jgi:hypothetical protein
LLSDGSTDTGRRCFLDAIENLWWSLLQTTPTLATIKERVALNHARKDGSSGFTGDDAASRSEVAWGRGEAAHEDGSGAAAAGTSSLVGGWPDCRLWWRRSGKSYGAGVAVTQSQFFCVLQV